MNQMGTKTIYIKDEDAEMIKRAGKLARFHEERSLGDLLKVECERVIKRYDSNDQTTEK